VGPSHGIGLLERTVDVRTEYAGGSTPSYLFALSAEPLAFWYEWNTVAFLMDSEIASVTENNGVCVFAVTVIADRAFAVWLVSGGCRLTVHGRC